MVKGEGTDLTIEGTYEMKEDDVIHMDILAKPPFWDPVKKGDEMFFLCGKMSGDSFILHRPTSDDPRFFVRARCTRNIQNSVD